MNIDSPIRSFRLRLAGLVLTICAFVLGSVPTTKAEYNFTLIADSTGPLRTIFFDSETLNSTGTVAFQAYLDNGSRGIFAGNGGPLTTITVTSLPFASFSNPSINTARTVAFEMTPRSGFEPRIYAGNGGPLTTIADTAGQFRDFTGGDSVLINTAGTVAFMGYLDSGPGGIFSGNGGATTTILVNSAALGVGSGISMNDAGTFAFNSGSRRIVTFNGGLVTTIVDNSGPLNFFGSVPSLNSAGTVAFVAGVGGEDGGTFGIYKGNGGPLTTIADLSGPFSYLGGFNSYQPSINASGMVAFGAALDAGGGGVFIGDGTTTSEVIQAGDALFGSIVTGAGVSPNSLNDSGQVAFTYTLANGTRGIAIATPVPEPGSASLLFGGLLAVLGLRRRCVR